MLEVRPSNDVGLNNMLAKECGIFDKDVKYAFLLFEDNQPIGISIVKIDLTSTIEKVGILPLKRGKRNGDFLTRVMIYKLIMVAKTIRIGYESPYFIPFGFKSCGGYMESDVENITFPHSCGGEC